MSVRNSFSFAVAAAIAAMALLITAPPVNASTITWGTPQQITNNTDVSTTGTLFQAANFNGSNVTVNGVTFSGFAVTAGGTSATSGNIGVTGTNFSPATLSTSSTPYGALSLNYRNLLGPVLTQGASSPLNFTLSNLTIGDTYQIQYWVNDPRTNSLGRTVNVGSVVLDPNTSADTSGGLGQFVLGQFVADAATQSFSASPASGSITYANAIQVRVIPEPGTCALAAAGLVVAGFFPLIRRSREARNHPGA